MSTAAAISIRQYLASNYRPDREYIDGGVVERHIGEREHSSFQMNISGNLWVRRQELGIVVLPGLRVQVSATRFQSFGVPHIWVIDPKKPRAFQYTPAGIQKAKDCILRTTNPDISMPLLNLENQG